MWLNYRSRLSMWMVEAVVAVNMIYLSGRPLLEGDAFVFDPVPSQSIIEYIFRGTGLGTVGFWVRVVSVIASILILVSFPRKGNPKKLQKTRMWSNFVVAMLFLYVVIIIGIFGGVAPILDLLWVQPIVYSMILSVAFLANSLELKQHDE